MKILKYFFYLALTFFYAFLLTGCTDDDETKLAWINGQNSTTVQDIKWMSSGTQDQIWEGVLGADAETDSKEVTQLSGNGECLDSDGNTYIIEYLDSNNERQQTLTLEEGDSKTITIDNLAAKKKKD